MMKEQSQTQLWLNKGALISNNDREYVIEAVLDIDKILAKDTKTGERVFINLGDLGRPRPVKQSQATATSTERDLLAVTTADWAIAERRRQWINPLLSGHSAYSTSLASEIAKDAQVSRATVYRWIAAFRNTGLLSSLLPKTHGRGGKSGTRIDPVVEAIIADVIKNFHDTDQKPTITATTEEIRRQCSNAGLKLPASNTIRVRLERTAGRARTQQRLGEATAHARHDTHQGTIPDADWPLAIVQIDHTLLPIIIVDDVHRKPINRAWITLAIDVNSRVCLGKYLSLDAPSAMSAGMCIAHAMLPKESWLKRLQVSSEIRWPFYGAMGALHMDNAREFRGEMLKVACRQYDVDIHLRPVKKPRYGAHIERLMGTVTEGLKTVKGSTFSGPDEKGEYDAEGNACMTFAEVERWLVLFFAKYHITNHGGINTTPLQKWREGVIGTKTKPGRGIPPRILDEEVLRINFTPFEERTIQAYGVVIDEVHYYHDVLRAWIDCPHPEFPRHKRKFRFHRDPRDISQLYFFDELSNRYCAIPYRDSSLPPVSIWERREAQRKASARGVPRENEKAVFAILNEQRLLEATAAAKTKTARREQQRRVEHRKQRETKTVTMPTVSYPSPQMQSPPAVSGYNADDVVPLDDD